MMEHLWEMAELEQKMGYVCVHVSAHRGQKISIAQKNHVIYTSVTSGDFLDAVDQESGLCLYCCVVFCWFENLEIDCNDGALQAKMWRDSHIKGGVTRAAV